MIFNPGFNIEPTTNPMGFVYGADVFGPQVENRLLKDIRKSLSDPDCEGPEVVYAIAMDVGKKIHAELLKERHLLYGVVNKGIPWPLGAFENRRSFTSIGNLCVVIDGFLTKNVPSGIYHMGDDEALSTNELIQVICEALGKKVHIWHIPKGLMNGVAKVGGWFHLPLNPLRMRKLTENYVVSNAKIKAALGITRMPVRAKDGLMDTIRSFKQ